MEDVVLHYQSGSADGLSSLLERAEKLLEPFPCRTPPVFKPWFPTATADHRLPIRPAKPAPVINPPGELLDSDSRSHTPAAVTQSLAGNEVQKPNTDKLIPEKICDRTRAESPPEKPQNGKEYFCISETPNDHLPTSPRHKPERGVTRLSPNKPPQKDKDGVTVIHSPVKRSWSVFTQGGVLLQSSQSLSKPFHHVVSVHRLHLRQRAKWVISQNNCGSAGDIEQVSRSYMKQDS